MAWRASEHTAGVPRAPGLGRCHGSSASEDPMQVPSLAKNASAAKDPVLPRNVLSERERRKRISASCERLRALLPSFDGRREDMASVLEMAVQFLRLAHSLGPGWEQHRVPAPSRATWHTWQGDVMQWTLTSQVSAGGSDPGTVASGLTPQQDPLGCPARGVGESMAPAGLSERLDGLPSLPGPSSLGARAPWPSCTWQPSSSKTNEEAASRPGQAGPLDRAATSPARLAREVALMPALDIRSVSGLDVEVGECFPLSASPEWWPGPVEARGATPSGAPARSSPVDRAEPGFLDDPVPSPQEPQDGPLELWGSDMDSWGLDLQDDSVDGIFADFLGC
ncbi:spermatogenesis- and oogenesis-specific basic helix-loop-helix-containing protein 1 isoform X2 [Heterocephalus glaber]|uniref:Spermatogenesis- and oogenesis-specific basic helix-loop-helix-containing protein 1 isoform X2 n=1 Tax=Heterocephalus glaber TaxID=10181 RepID=A0AAX6T8T9_HETGA|nr:spermatogenesis- and oogenesis-specific basic helix-loop-helix-containing protein 1 isoform X2 [Heterocephalus glaber]